MTSELARLMVWIFVLTGLNLPGAFAQTKKLAAGTTETAWKHPLFHVKPVRKTAKDAARVELSVGVTNPNSMPLAFLAFASDQPPHVPVFSVEYRRAGKWRGFLDHDPEVQPLKGIRDGELGAGDSVEGRIFLPPDWERMRVGFAWRLSDVRPTPIISWGREIAREELAEKGGNAKAPRKAQAPKLRVLSVTQHVNKDFHGTSVQLEIHNPAQRAISYYGFLPTAFSPPTAAGTIRPFGGRYELTHKSVTSVKEVHIDCPVGGARLDLPPGAKAVFSVWAQVVDEWDSMRVGLRWINGEAGDGQQTAWTAPFKRSRPGGSAKPNSRRAGAAKAAQNGAYVATFDEQSPFYARCVPDESKGSKGVTQIVRVRAKGDEVITTYSWFNKNGLVLGWSPKAGKVAVMRLRQDEGLPAKEQVELSFYLGDQFLQSFTTADLVKLGAKVSRDAAAIENGSGVSSRRAEYRVEGCQQLPRTNDYYFLVRLDETRTLSFDVLTGKLCRIEQDGNTQRLAPVEKED